MPPPPHAPSLSSPRAAARVGAALVSVGVPREAGDEGPRRAGPSVHSLGPTSAPLEEIEAVVCMGSGHLREVVLKPLEAL